MNKGEIETRTGTTKKCFETFEVEVQTFITDKTFKNNKNNNNLTEMKYFHDNKFMKTDRY